MAGTCYSKKRFWVIGMVDTSAHGLSDREREILREVIELYLMCGEPVASAGVAARSRTGLSSASIRTVMAELEAKGFLSQPHTSAGREPSNQGFRYYTDVVARGAVLAPAERRRLRTLLVPGGPLEEVLAKASRVLADVTVEVGVALAPAPHQAALRSLHFVSVASRRVLAVLVTQGGLVDSRLLLVERDFQQDELERISNYCTQMFAGKPLAQIRSELAALMLEERARCDELLAGAVELAKQAVDSEVEGSGDLFVEGTNRVLASADPAQLEKLERLFATLSDKTSLLSLLNRFIVASGPRVVMGPDFTLPGGEDFGLIVTSFELPSGENGVVGVIGLKRMNYPHIIPIVDFVGHRVAEVSWSPEEQA